MKTSSIFTCGVALVASLGLNGACSGQAFEGEGPSGTLGGNRSAGGGSATGGKGMTGGGKATGGAPSGGQGNVMGGSSAVGGGLATGGTGAGGTIGSGGASSVGGGTSTGGAASVNSCNSASECVACAYPSAPKNPNECYCATCPTTPMSAELCTHNQQAFQAQGCDMNVCPLPPCVVPPPLSCDSNRCVFKDSGPSECQTNADCTNCVFTLAPQNSNECYCTGCGEPMSKTECTKNNEAWNDQGCATSMAPCLPIACVQPGPAECSAEGKCVAGASPGF